jgi:drug/metabolite transporter (DMT)-like permease
MKPQFGIYGMWYSMMYLPLAEATVITFLAPSVAGYICHVLLKDPYTRTEQIASFIALAGVVLIARPTSLFGSQDSNDHQPVPPATVPASANLTSPHVPMSPEPTPAQRLSAILVALVGVLGAAGAFTTIRIIGTRAHALITVNYFSAWSTVVSTAALLLGPALGIGQPGVSFAGLIPESAYHWLLLLALGACGFIMQFMMTAGIGGDRAKSNRATAMVYTHMLFAAGFDRFVFGHRMGVISLVGCGLVVGSAVWAALGKKEGKSGGERADVERAVRQGERGEEGTPMLVEEAGEEEDGGMELERVR